MTSSVFQARWPRQSPQSGPTPAVSQSPSRCGRLVPVVVAAICLAPFTPLLLPDDRVIPDNLLCDYGSFQLPIREFARDEFLGGHFPLWIPYLGCGTPLHAGQQASLCHPILTPLVVLLGANQGLKVSLFLQLALAFTGTYLLARDLSISRWGVSLAGVVVTWGAFPVMHLMEGHVTILLEYAAVPWLFLVLNRLLRRPTPRNAAFAALAIGWMALCGQPQIQYYALLVASLWAVGSLVRGAAAASRLRAVFWGIAAVACGCLLGGVQLLPAWELTRDGIAKSDRGTPDYASQHALDAADLGRLLVPNALGNPLCGLKRFDEADHFHERIGYVGLLPLALVVYGLTRRCAARWQWGAALLVLFGLTVALGKHTPLFGPLGWAVPGLTLFRCPGRMFAVLTPLVALLAGRGLDAWAAREPSGGLRAAIGLIAAAAYFLALIVFSGGAAMFDREGWTRYWSYARQHVPWELAGSAATSTVAFLVLAFLPKRLPPRWCCIAALAAAMLDLGDQTIGNFSLERREQGTGNRAEGTVGSAANINSVRVADHANFQFWPGSLNYSRLVPLVVADRLPSLITNEGGVLPGGLSRLYRAIEKTPSVALALASCNVTCSRTGDLWEPLGGALARIRLLRAADRELVSTPLEEMTRVALDSIHEGLLGDAQIDHEDPQNLALRLSAPEDGILVVADLFYPGWHCEVDGRPVAIEPAHGVFRAVSLSQGDHHVEFVFRSASFRWGACCSLAALFIVGVLVLVQSPKS